MNVKDIGILVLGAAAAALPIAEKYGEACLVADNGITPGGEFADTFNYTPFDGSHPLSALAANVKEELLARGLMTASGSFHIPPLGGVLCGRFLRTGCRLLAETSVVSVADADGKYLVTLFNAKDGYTVYRAERVIDTRTHAFMPCRTTFAVLLAGETNAMSFDSPDVTVQHGAFDDEYAVHFTALFNESISDCQRRAYAFLQENRVSLGKARVAGIAMRKAHFFEKPFDETRGGIRYLASESFPTPLDAITGGERI